ncbi:MAG TPA: purine-nucleoside phosphorylase [Chthoniobacterales bacterium]|jgi:purine-nucleoside phosphorylase|nr:purine-nucleoside phosphorylase [Chthoniobacterales bacterium]
MTTGLQRLRDYGADTAIILGSGLNAIIAEPKKDQVVPYAEFSEIPKPTVEGHLGRFVLDEIEKTKIVFSQGRVHLYEGHSARDVTSIVRVLARVGIKQLIVTNAAGALNPKFKPGEWMMIADHINLTGQSPLVERDNASPARTRGRSIAPGRRDSPIFVDMTNAYLPRLREKFRAAAKNADIVLHEGVYAGLVGPQYETPAEVRMLQKLGADAVGMSTVLEVIQARALGLEAAGFSCLTNLAAGLSQEKLGHDEVLEIGRKAAAQFAKLLQATVPSL